MPNIVYYIIYLYYVDIQAIIRNTVDAIQESPPINVQSVQQGTKPETHSSVI